MKKYVGKDNCIVKGLQFRSIADDESPCFEIDDTRCYIRSGDWLVFDTSWRIVDVFSDKGFKEAFKEVPE